MFKNELLNEKYRVQERLSKKVKHNLLKYAELIHKTVADFEKTSKIRFQYSSPN